MGGGGWGGGVQPNPTKKGGGGRVLFIFSSSLVYSVTWRVDIQGRSLAQIRGGQCLLSKYQWPVSTNWLS